MSHDDNNGNGKFKDVYILAKNRSMRKKNYEKSSFQRFT